MKPWVHTAKTGLSFVGVALTEQAFALDRIVPPLCRTFLSSSRNHLYLLFHGLALACPQAGAYRVSYYSYLCKDLILGML